MPDLILEPLRCTRVAVLPTLHVGGGVERARREVLVVASCGAPGAGGRGRQCEWRHTARGQRPDVRVPACVCWPPGRPGSRPGTVMYCRLGL